MEFVRIGVIVKPNGIKGSLKIKTFTSFVSERFKKGSVIYKLTGKDYVPVTIGATRGASSKKLGDDDDIIFITFKGFEDINLVESWRSQELYIAKEDLHDLEDGEVYYYQLRGLEVYENNIKLGIVSELIETGANLVLRVNGETELLIPYVDAFIESVDLDAQRIDVKLIEGMR